MNEGLDLGGEAGGCRFAGLTLRRGLPFACDLGGGDAATGLVGEAVDAVADAGDALAAALATERGDGEAWA